MVRADFRREGEWCTLQVLGGGGGLAQDKSGVDKIGAKKSVPNFLDHFEN